MDIATEELDFEVLLLGFQSPMWPYLVKTVER